MKDFFWEITPPLIGWLFSFFLVSWLVEGSFWLHFFLAGGMSGGSYVTTKITKLRELILEVDTKTNITDYEVVRISPLVDDHEDKIDELEKKVDQLQDEVNHLKYGAD